jgi:hypothetical protein
MLVNGGYVLFRHFLWWDWQASVGFTFGVVSVRFNVNQLLEKGV